MKKNKKRYGEKKEKGKDVIRCKHTGEERRNEKTAGCFITFTALSSGDQSGQNYGTTMTVKHSEEKDKSGGKKGRGRNRTEPLQCSQ